MPPQNTINIQASTQDFQGKYANLFQVSHQNKEAFLFDFLFMDPLRAFGSLASRVIVSPELAKRTAKALEENIKNYESKFGEIKLEDSSHPPEVGFRVKE